MTSPAAPPPGGARCCMLGQRARKPHATRTRSLDRPTHRRGRHCEPKPTSREKGRLHSARTARDAVGSGAGSARNRLPCGPEGAARRPQPPWERGPARLDGRQLRGLHYVGIKTVRALRAMVRRFEEAYKGRDSASAVTSRYRRTSFRRLFGLIPAHERRIVHRRSHPLGDLGRSCVSSRTGWKYPTLV
jgi:hypothetical protein